MDEIIEDIKTKENALNNSRLIVDVCFRPYFKGARL